MKDKVDAVLIILRDICPYSKIEGDTELIESGILTSLDLFELIVGLEEQFNIHIDEDLIDPDNFQSASVISEKLLP